MSRVLSVVPPWAVPLTGEQHVLIQYVVVVAAFALATMLTRLWSARAEVGDRYRPTVHAGIGAVGVAFLSYVLLALELQAGYRHRGGIWMPTPDAVGTFSARYMDWTVSVPLLVIAISGVSAFTGQALRVARAVGVTAAVGMVVLGFLGGVVVGDGADFGSLLAFGLASAACFAVLYGVVITVVVRSLPVLPPAARRPLRNAMLVLIVSWFTYPIVFGFQGFVADGAYTTAAQVALSAADVAAKVLFGLLLLRVARVRTAVDVVAGEDVRAEAVWIDQLRQSAAVAPPSER